MIEITCIFTLCFAVAVFFYGIQRYCTPVNPISIFSAINFGVFTILSGAICLCDNSCRNFAPMSVIATALISCMHFAGWVSPYFIKTDRIYALYGILVNSLRSRSWASNYDFRPIKFWSLIGGFTVSFFLLAILGGGGFLWITNSRLAYLNYRTGVGVFYAITQWLIVSAMLYLIWFSRPKGCNMVAMIALASVPIYFLGSKNNILSLVIIGLVYYNFYLNRISLTVFGLTSVVLVWLFILLLIIQGSYPTLSSAPNYFKDYFNTTLLFIDRFSEFGFRYGLAGLSSLWFYLPRSLFRDKPFEYGITLIHGVLFPGSAALGHTPGILMWALPYLDFGVCGVFSYGFALGLLSKTAYEFFLANKNNFFAFVLAIQFSIWQIFPFSTIVITMLWVFIFSIYLKLIWRHAL